MIWKADAPSNIALIKYMGKTDFDENTPANPSLSYTLEGLRSRVEIRKISDESDRWVCLEGPGLDPEFALSPKGKEKFLLHLKRFKDRFGYEGSLEVRSNNTFPSDCGLASSASSFAALSHCAARALSDLTGQGISRERILEMSRRGSGSSCRSFSGPWVLWNEKGTHALDLPRLNHAVVVVEGKIKSVSSSEAHRRVSTSFLFEGRSLRAERRLKSLVEALRSGGWKDAFELVWAEFWDMHALFETANPPFGYMLPQTLEVLGVIRSVWAAENDGPLVTLDAGPNLHLLFRPDQRDLQTSLLQRFRGVYQIWESPR